MKLVNFIPRKTCLYEEDLGKRLGSKTTTTFIWLELSALFLVDALVLSEHVQEKTQRASFSKI